MSSIYEALQRARQGGRSGAGLRPPPAPAAPPPAASPIGHALAPLLAAVRPLIDAAEGAVFHLVAATPGEGASTIAREFALAAAAAGIGHTALVDADRRTLATARAFGCDPRRGLAEALRPDGGGLGEALQPAAGAPLAVAALFGEAGPGQAEAATVREVYRRLKEQFRLVVVDCPPVTGGEFPALAPEAGDGVILVVRAETTRPAVVAHAKAQIEQCGATLLGAVLNRRTNYIPDFLYRML
jgi:receptor protein-tyrosine kinase